MPGPTKFRVLAGIVPSVGFRKVDNSLVVSVLRASLKLVPVPPPVHSVQRDNTRRNWDRGVAICAVGASFNCIRVETSVKTVDVVFIKTNQVRRTVNSVQQGHRLPMWVRLC